MDTPYRVVRLQRNHLYPTYQLFAHMASKKTTPQDGLRLAALTTMEWLRLRLGDAVPKELLLPGPEEFRSCSEEALQSLHLNAGFVIDIVSLPEQGAWSLQITEPDLGSDPGNPKQARQAVPGRIIETNIGFRIVGHQLQCGFQTVVSDVAGGDVLAEVYRLAVVKRLANNPDFGLQQLTPLLPKVMEISTGEQLNRVGSVLRSEENQLPTVVFTYVRRRREISLSGTGAFSFDVMMPALKPMVRTEVQGPPYPICDFARHGLGFCRTYLLADELLDKLQGRIEQKVTAGDILFAEPMCFGGKFTLLPLKASMQSQQETIEQLTSLVLNYPRERRVEFGRVWFLGAARSGLLENSRQVYQQVDHVAAQWSQQKTELEERYAHELALLRFDQEELTKQIKRQKIYIDQLEEEKRSIRLACQQEVEKVMRQSDAREAYTSYLERRLARPAKYGEIAAWVEQQFQGRLLLHKKAIDLLTERDAAGVDLNLICDALDFLATDYWSARYDRLPTEEMLTRCSEKYGRPFEVKPTGVITIEYTPGQYKIKYFPGRNGKPVESALDYHLRVGNDPENLLRIYFLHDDKKQCIVVGSLPRHLRSVKIQ